MKSQNTNKTQAQNYKNPNVSYLKFEYWYLFVICVLQFVI
jgi:hypothetical protein